MNTPHHRTIRLATGALLIAALAGCAVTEENPLNVNAANANNQGATGEQEGSSPLPSSSDTAIPDGSADGGATSAADGTENDAATFITESLDDDPLNIRADGATLCGVQPQDSFLQYTIMLYNPTLETFTFDSIDLVDAQGLRQVDAKVAPANREGHGNHGASPAQASEHGNATHNATPTPSPSASEPSTFSVTPVPAVGYSFEPDQHINIVVSVALNDAATRGTADDILVGFSTAGRQFSVPHDLNITIDRTTCS
ncbi:hypothetical protein V6S67_18995 [Arthrobacter sp. Soc17.1.1.1]|uniref:hypothetical protein n=1 Tax=Arthrobacter sp. Soc17.1.1.1 TaxID=3121277 RepID=UPI002FE4D10F